MDIRQVNDDFGVSGQIEPSDIPAIKQAGYRSIICNRPDDEQHGQPPAAQVGAAAEAAGLGFRHIPFTTGQMTEKEVKQMAEALRELPGPVFAYCRSGGRSTSVYMAAREAGA